MFCSDLYINIDINTSLSLSLSFSTHTGVEKFAFLSKQISVGQSYIKCANSVQIICIHQINWPYIFGIVFERGEEMGVTHAVSDRLLIYG